VVREGGAVQKGKKVDQEFIRQGGVAGITRKNPLVAYRKHREEGGSDQGWRTI